MTATYQRASLLPVLYASLRAQSYHDFEWLVIDDGSTDGTDELVRGWAAEAPFQIRYHHQENAGKHTALNAGARLARGEFCATIDSDDEYVPDGLQVLVEAWESIPEKDRDGYSNVEGNAVAEDGTLIGDRVPAPVFDSDAFDRRWRHGIRGDKLGMYRRDLLLANPFPDIPGAYVPEDIIWFRIARTHRTRFVDRTVGIVHRSQQGLSRRGPARNVTVPEPLADYFGELLTMGRPLPPPLRLRSSANYVRFSIRARRGPRREVLRALPWWRWAAAMPLGLALVVRDRWLLRDDR